MKEHLTPEELLRIKQVLEQAGREKSLQETLKALGPAVVEGLRPVLDEIVRSSKFTKEDLLDAIAAIKFPKSEINLSLPKLDIPMPEITFPDIKIPKPEVIVNVPEIKIPTPKITVNAPDNKDLIKSLTKGFNEIKDAVSVQQVPFADQIAQGMKSIDFKHPMPVILTDHEGKPYIAGQFGGGGRSGGPMSLKDAAGNLATISQLTDSLGVLNVAIFDSTGAQVNSFGGSVQQVSGAVDSVVVNDVLVSLAVKQVSGFVDSVNVVTTVGLTNTELRATTLDVKQVSGSNDSVNVVSSVLPSGAATSANQQTDALTDTQLRASTLDVKQVSGSNDSVNVVSSVLPTGAATAANQQTDALTDTQLRASTLDVKQVSGSTDSINVITTVGLTDAQLRASTLDVKQVSGASDSVSVLNTVTVTGALDTVRASGVTRQANPTAVVADVVPIGLDDLGRQISRPVQVRDLISTAYVTLSNGTETTLLAAGGAGVMHDLIYIMGANTSGAAVQVDFRAVTAGNVMFSLMIPASGTAGVSLPVPIPQSEPNNNWTADMGDITNSNVLISALFSKEI